MLQYVSLTVNGVFQSSKVQSFLHQAVTIRKSVSQYVYKAVEAQ